MGGRGTFAAGNPVAYTYKTVGNVNGVKVLEALGTNHGLPASSHSSNAYIKLKPDGTFHELRVYDSSHSLVLEIAYHAEYPLTGNNSNVLHYHVYDERFSKNRSGPFLRSKAAYLTPRMKKLYGSFFIGVKNI